MKKINHISFGLLLTIVLAAALFTSCKKEEESNTHINADGVTGTVKDVDGNSYAIMKIGEQWWMVENLKVTRYNDGTAIPNVTDATEWSNLTTGAYASYDNDDSNTARYGLFYNWYVVSTGKLAPEGWHVPSSAEWDSLKNYAADNYGTSGSAAKALASATGWTTSTSTGAIGNDQSINNSIGFSAIPCGYRYDDGLFRSTGSYSVWWSEQECSSTEANFCYLYFGSSDLYIYYDSKGYGFSVRCVMD